MIPFADSSGLSRSARRGLAIVLAIFPMTVRAQSDSASRGHAQGTRPAHSLVIAADSTRSRSGVAAQIRSLLDTTTVTLDRLEVHKTSLVPGASPHPPHRHSHEELMLVERGTLEVLQEGAIRKATAGAMIFEASNELHGLKNVGADTATYWVIAMYPRGLK
jgi:quercetin dioxygenase-like cupin family protein